MGGQLPLIRNLQGHQIIEIFECQAHMLLLGTFLRIYDLLMLRGTRAEIACTERLSALVFLSSIDESSHNLLARNVLLLARQVRRSLVVSILSFAFNGFHLFFDWALFHPLVASILLLDILRPHGISAHCLLHRLCVILESALPLLAPADPDRLLTSPLLQHLNDHILLRSVST